MGFEFDTESIKEWELERSAATSILKWSSAPYKLTLEIERREDELTGEKKITLERLLEFGFPAALTTLARPFRKDFRFYELFSKPNDLPLVRHFVERYDWLLERRATSKSVVGVVFRYPGVQSLMLLRTGSPSATGTVIAIKPTGHKTRFIEPLEQFITELVQNQSTSWWDGWAD